MSRGLNAHDFETTYESLGIDLNALGCIMLDVTPHQDLSKVISDHWRYTSPDPKKFWFNNVLDNLHVSLLYGLLENGGVWQDYVDEVLADWQPGLVEVDYIDAFPSPLEDEDYTCIVAKLRLTDNLMEAHHRLSFLPHINTYPTFTPHITLAYVQSAYEKSTIRAFSENLPIHFDPTGLNYGSRKKA